MKTNPFKTNNRIFMKDVARIMQENEVIVPELNSKTIELMIYIIREKKVMLDFELAKIYGYETKRFNEQVKNNANKFDYDFRFQLTKDEFAVILKSKKSASSWGGTRKLPYAFTEQGIYMLMTILKGDLATRQSKSLIRAFKQMKDYIIESSGLLLNTNSYIESKFSSYDKRFENMENKLEIVMDNFVDPNTYKHYLIKDGERLEADIAYQEIYKLAKQSIYIIDNFIDVKTLQLLKCCSVFIEVVVFTENKGRNNLNSYFINDFKNDTGLSITIKENKNKFHDRYIVLDFGTNSETIYHCGGSSKDGGKKITTIMKIEDKELYEQLIIEILNNDELVL